MTTLSLISFLLAAVSAQTDAPLLTGEKVLFLDDALVASKENVVRTVHSPAKYEGNPVLWPTEPWEGNVALLYGSVLQDGGKFRMWYHNGMGVGYAESEDGITWTKPMLGLFENEGHDTNTVILRDAEADQPNCLPYFYELFGVHKAGDGGYVMGYLSLQRDYEGPRTGPFHGRQRRGLGVAKSEDGIHWTLVENWATEAICDGGTHWMHDPKSGNYVLYGRTKFIAEGLLDAWDANPWVRSKFWGRSVARVESPDFLAWDFRDPKSAPVVMTPGPDGGPGDEIYALNVFPYESVYIGLPQIFHNQEDACHLDIHLAVSHDSIDFEPVGDGAAFLPCGPAGAWDRFNTSVANNPPIQVGDELRFYFSGRTYRHSPYNGPDKGEPGGGIGFATIKRDRFVSLDASFDPGIVETVPLRLAGKGLHLNLESAFGRVTVEVLEAGSAEVLAVSKPVKEDSLDAAVEWEQGGYPPADEPVILRFTLQNARLYAVWSQ